MRAMVVDAFGSIEDLHEADLPVPDPGPGEVRVRVRASCANHADTKAITGEVKLMHSGEFPRVVGYDLSGVVDAVGAGVHDLAVGDEVFGHLAYSRQTKLGTFAEYTVAPAASLARKPEAISHEVAAASATAGLTALQALRDLGGLGLPEDGRPPGGTEEGNGGGSGPRHALIVGASGGVGSVAVGVARRLGARVTAIASSSSADFVRSLGADEVVERDRTDPFVGSDPYDVVFDTPAVHSYGQWVHRLKPGGSYVTTLPSFSFVTGKLRSWLSGKGCHLVIVRSRRADLELLGRWIVDGLPVPIEETYPLERVAEALKRLDRGGMRGRLAIRVS